jgi:glucan phosphoethanolaminetransferase (alkaline phosphatase superfamily)
MLEQEQEEKNELDIIMPYENRHLGNHSLPWLVRDRLSHFVSFFRWCLSWSTLTKKISFWYLVTYWIPSTEKNAASASSSQINPSCPLFYIYFIYFIITITIAFYIELYSYYLPLLFFLFSYCISCIITIHTQTYTSFLAWCKKKNQHNPFAQK